MTMARLGDRFPDYPAPDGETQSSFLRHIAEIGGSLFSNSISN